MATVSDKKASAVNVECLHELFEAQTDLRPEKLALICGNERLSYEEVERRANQLAHYLRQLFIGPGKLVGIYFDRSEMPIISILAILKAGAAYVPIDPVYPADRARHILSEAEVTVLLTERMLVEKAETFFAGSIIALDERAAEIAEESVERLSCEVTGVAATDLCYVLYTSGTTGRPKGVMTEHRNVVKFTAAFNEVHRINHKDRVFQGFSLGFDGSVEEIWMAFSNGGTLVVGTSDVVKFGDEVARVFEEEQVTVFSTVPTFLSMIAKPLPSVRVVIVSGEPCPPDLVKKWARPGLRMLNVYGPTETTVNTTVAECTRDKPVTIGRPLRGYDVYILDEAMQPVAPGTPGELYIGGVGVARGYFQQPELTQKQFVPSPFHVIGNGNGLVNGNGHRKEKTKKKKSSNGKPHNNGSSSNQGRVPMLYRTGDLVCLTEDGDLQFLRRIDRQVKIRGYRIELSEIESVLRDEPQVYQAVVNVFEREGLKEIAAYVVPRKESANGSFDRDAVLQLLRDRLPPYMVPGYLDLIDKMPTLASGKADRSQLPAPKLPLVSSNRTVVAPATPMEEKVCAVWEKLFRVTPISCTDDFFMDLGGYSLLAAEMASLLRAEYKFEVAIRDVYKHPTVQQLAAHLTESLEAKSSQDETKEAAPQRRTSRQVFESQSRWTRWTCYSLQALMLGISYGVVSIPLMVTVLLIVGVIKGTVSLATLVFCLIALIFLTLPAAIVLSIVSKWIIIGRYKPGEYPLWSFYYFRWWLATRVQGLSGVGRFAGTPIMSLYYRLMGAKVGKNCIIDTGLCAIYDLVTIGDDTSIGAQTHLLGYRVEDGMLKIGRTTIGSRCFVGTHSGFGLNTKMGDDSYLGDLSLLPDGAEMKAGESRRGSPAEPADVDLPKFDPEKSSRRHPFWFGLAHFVASEITGELLLLTSILPLIVVIMVYVYFGLAWATASLFMMVPVSIVSFALIVAGIKALIMKQTTPGTYPVESMFFLRKWCVDVLLSDTGRLLNSVYTTIYLPPWLRLLGAKIGRRAEISTVTLMTPDLMRIEDESFFADGSMVGGRRFFRGHVQLEINRIGKRSFVGNNALLPVGKHLGENCLLGVISVPPGAIGSTTPEGTEWLGSPPFRLPYRKKVEGIDITGTFEPTRKLYIQRYLIDGLRVVLPGLISTASFVAYATAVVMAFLYLPLWGVFLAVPPIASLIAFGVAISVVVVKKILMGKFVPVIKPLWCTYVWFNEVVNGVYEGLGMILMSPLMGTPFLAWYLRAMGCKVGKHCFLETGLFSEFDLVEIGDYAALNAGVVIQNHLFEDRIMKSSYLTIGDECSVGNMSVVLYDSEMKRGSCIGPMSLLMKGETLPENTRWLGIPVAQIQ